MAESASGLPFPAQLELKRGNLAENWKKFQRVWDNYEIASGLVEKDAKLRKATLLTCLGADAIELFETFPLSEDDRKDPAKIIDAFKSHCIGVTNETYERYNFNARTQEPGESIDGYTSVLRTLAKTCNYGVLEESLIRDRMVIGIRDNGTRKKLLQEKDLTLNRCIDICRANEKTDEQLKSINSEDVAVVYKQKDKKDKKSNVSKPKPNVRECWFCGNKHAPNKESCPAYGEKCNLCGGMNHFARKCKKVKEKKEKKQKKKGKVHLVNQSAESTDSEDDYCFIVDEAGKYPKKLFAKVSINNHQVKCQLDGGATVNILSDTDYMRVCDDQWMDKLVKSSVQLVMYNKTHIKTLGKRKLKVRNPKNKKDYTLEFVVVQGSVQPLLGAQALQMMDFITVNREHILAVNVSQSSEMLIEEYKDVFEGEGRLQGKLHLELEPNSKPVKQPVRKVPVAVKPRLKKEIDRLVKLGMIEEVKQPTEWISSMVVVNKSNNKVRLCLDPKPLNKCLKRNNYPIPTIENILPELSNAKIFTVADAKNGFWHVDLDSESSDLLTFGTPWGRYKWKRMAFGISVAPEEFQRRIDEALEGLEGVKAIHDDILIWGSGKSEQEAIEDHDQKLATLLQRCREKGLKLNRDKLKLKQKEVTFRALGNDSTVV